MVLRNSLECLYRINDENINKDTCNLFELDPSADPEPHPLSQLNTSLQSLLRRSDCSDCGLSRRGIGDLSIITNDLEEVSQCENDGIGEDFIELLSRMQCKRINDQRCDPDMLAHLTNRTNGSIRQSDTLTCTGEDGPGDASNITQRARRKFLLFFERFGKRRFRPVVASTPLQRPTSMLRPTTGYSGVGHSYSDGNNDDTFSLGVGSVKSDNFLKDVEKDSCSTISSPVFRVPVDIPRKNHPCCSSTASSDAGNNAVQPSKQEGMLDLIANLQGRRMEEQRAALNGRDGVIDEGLSQRDEIEVFEDAGQLYDLVIRSQGDRLDEQRSELAITQPEEDVSRIVLDMQKGRIEGQRANLEPRNSN
uniref:SCHIP-1 domain-containing protein n=1 Tax=Syphacia muris TaxID=451379 RepID=A0A0N5AYK1_9BILA